MRPSVDSSANRELGQSIGQSNGQPPANLLTSLKEDLFNTYLTVQFEVRKQFRRKRLFIALALALAIPLLFYLIPLALGSDFPDSAAGFAAQNLGFVSVLAVVSAVMFAGDAVSDEYEKKTGLLLFPTPQRRTTIFVGKYLASILCALMVVSFYYLVTGLELLTIYSYKEIPGTEYGRSYLLALLYATCLVSGLFLLSSLTNKTMTATVFGFFLFMMIMPIITSVISIASVDPWFMVTHNNSLITDVFESDSGFFEGPGHGKEARTTFTPDMTTGVWVMLAYAILPFLAAVHTANTRSMEI